MSLTCTSGSSLGQPGPGPARAAPLGATSAILHVVVPGDVRSSSNPKILGCPVPSSAPSSTVGRKMLWPMFCLRRTPLPTAWRSLSPPLWYRLILPDSADNVPRSATSRIHGRLPVLARVRTTPPRTADRNPRAAAPGFTWSSLPGPASCSSISGFPIRRPHLVNPDQVLRGHSPNISLWSTWTTLLQQTRPPRSCAGCKTAALLSDHPHFHELSRASCRFSPPRVP